MSWNRELTLDETLADPVIGAALKADRVDPRHFEALLRAAARKLDVRRPPTATAIRVSAALPAAPARFAGEHAARSRRIAAAGDCCAW